MLVPMSAADEIMDLCSVRANTGRACDYIDERVYDSVSQETYECLNFVVPRSQ